MRHGLVMCSHHISAIGVMREAYERGASVPQKLSVIGFDDVRIAQFVVPPLSCTVVTSGNGPSRVRSLADRTSAENTLTARYRIRSDHRLSLAKLNGSGIMSAESVELSPNLWRPCENCEVTTQSL